MQVTVTIPEDIFGQDSGTLAREVLERAALAAYQSEVISLGRLAEILSLSIDEAHGFLKAHGVPLTIGFEDIENGNRIFDTLFGRQ